MAPRMITMLQQRYDAAIERVQQRQTVRDLYELMTHPAKDMSYEGSPMLLVLLGKFLPVALHATVWRHEAEAASLKQLSFFRDKVMRQKRERIKARKKQVTEAKKALEEAVALGTTESEFDALEVLAAAIQLGEAACEAKMEAGVLTLLTEAEKCRARLVAEQWLAAAVLTAKTTRPMASAAVRRRLPLTFSCLKSPPSLTVSLSLSLPSGARGAPGCEGGRPRGWGRPAR